MTAPRHRRYRRSDLAATGHSPLYSRSPGTNVVMAVLLITSLLSHLTPALRHPVTSGTVTRLNEETACTSQYHTVLSRPVVIAHHVS
ncbi:hypothetical protein EV368DRAFT_90354 [Lentinula lateritia]|nr:hypothetical protein EV368DRAFT_90354 [Lentinula lateritia]